MNQAEQDQKFTILLIMPLGIRFRTHSKNFVKGGEV